MSYWRRRQVGCWWLFVGSISIIVLLLLGLAFTLGRHYEATSCVGTEFSVHKGESFSPQKRSLSL